MAKRKDELKAAGVPYYGFHRIVEWTCPHCDGMLSFLINDKAGSKHICRCGTWWRVIDFYPDHKESWIYQTDGTFDRNRDNSSVNFNPQGA